MRGRHASFEAVRWPGRGGGFGVNPRRGCRYARVDGNMSMVEGANRYGYFVAVIEGLSEAHVHGAVVQPGLAEVFHGAGCQISVNGDAWDQSAFETVLGGNPIVVDLVFAVICGVPGAAADHDNSAAAVSV